MKKVPFLYIPKIWKRMLHLITNVRNINDSFSKQRHQVKCKVAHWKGFRVRSTCSTNKRVNEIVHNLTNQIHKKETSKEHHSDLKLIKITHNWCSHVQHEIRMFQSKLKARCSNKPLLQNGVERTRLHYIREIGRLNSIYKLIWLRLLMVLAGKIYSPLDYEGVCYFWGRIIFLPQKWFQQDLKLQARPSSFRYFWNTESTLVEER